jgi:Protein of unknown function (DUF3035)
MPQSIARFSVVLGLLALSACSADKLERTIGLTRDPPDEFAVTTRAPLAMPPDWQLTPPRPGASRPQEVSTQQAAEAALAPQTALGGTAGPDSPGQQALLRQSGPSAPSDIRHTVDAEAAKDGADRGFADRMMFWKGKPEPGTPLDPAVESQRLRQNAALGRGPGSGDVPALAPVQPKQEQSGSGGGFFSNLF